MRTMSIRLRFTLALTAVGVLLFGTYAVVSYRSERSDLRTAAIREIRIMGRSLETSLANALRDHRAADIETMLAALEALEPTIDVHVHDVDGRSLAHSRGASLDNEIENLVTRVASSRAEHVGFQPDDSPTRLLFAAPLESSDGKLLGAMAIARPIDDLEADLARTRRRLFIVVGAFLIATVFAGLVLGTLHVTRPIERLLEGVRHVREGDFRAPVSAVRRDEIGHLVDEFNAMIAVLAEARAKTEVEMESRARLEQGLQRIDKLVTIGQLSAGLAHEIGSPLQVVSGRASALLDHDDAEVRRQAQQLVEQCDRITRVVEQLLSFGRRRPAVIEPCNLVEPVRAVLDLLAGEARRHGVKLVMEVDTGSHRIEADPDQLQQVTLNLVKNALIATPRGGTIVVRVERGESSVRLVVKDNGKGIPVEMQSHLFEPFFTTRAQEGGTGLGLAVVRAIASEHHAKIDLRSEPDHGAEFVISFAPIREVVHHG
jgi:signal transduction histidine kinase